MGVGDYRVKPGDWELRNHVNEVCCFNSKLEWVKVCLKFEDAFFCALLQWWDFLIASLKVSIECYKALNLPLSEVVNAFKFCFIDNHQCC